MSEIDEATGLPKLPDGWYWHVGESSVSIRKPYPGMDWSEYPPDMYCAVLDGHIGGITETRRVEVVDKVWVDYIFFRTQENRKRNRMEYRLVNAWENVEEVFVDPQGALVTKANLLPLCEEALRAYMFRAESESLRGDYPPKSYEAAP